jgi:hypothetical protein
MHWIGGDEQYAYIQPAVTKVDGYWRKSICLCENSALKNWDMIVLIRDFPLYPCIRIPGILLSSAAVQVNAKQRSVTYAMSKRYL